MRPDEPAALAGEADHPDADPARPAAAHTGTWRVPRPVLVSSLKIALILATPLVIVYASAGGVAALAVAMGYTGSLTPALKLRPTYSLALAVPAAMTGVVASGLAGQALPAACFVALACLLVAPANLVQNGLMAGIPTIAAVYACLPTRQDPVQVGAWMLVGGAIVVGLSAMTRMSKSAEPVGVDLWTAWAHAIAMASVVGVFVLVLGVVDIAHGYWIAMTMTIVLRPYGTETQTVARQRVAGTTLGAVLALALAVLLPGWAALTVAVALLVLVVANALMGRYSQQVTFLTPFIVLIGSGGEEEAVGVAVQRVAATLLGALLAAAIALALWRVDQARQQT
jgi:hypothetical protein